TGQTVDLIPYAKEHVPLMNKWLQDPEMQQLVATEAITLEADYVFQAEVEQNGDIIGDIDLYFFPEGEAEINIMIASPEWRRHGYASEALTLAMQYAIQRTKTRKFIAKIGQKNEASLRFFERHGFQLTQVDPNVFDEYVYELNAGMVPLADLDIQSPFHITV
ncbi:hypothetical protein PSACC_01216, partial [Paramicrosporidium saccamoebae]